MEHEIETDIQLKRFLLGELPPGERESIEERLFLDSEYFQHFKAAEDDLIDEYLYGDLSADERERFEQYFLRESNRRESLEVAVALRDYLSKKKTADVAPEERAGSREDARQPGDNFFKLLWGRRPGSALRFSLAVGLLLLAASGVWLMMLFLRQEHPAPQQARHTEVQPSPTAQVARRETDNETKGGAPEETNRNTPVIKAAPQNEVAVATPNAVGENKRHNTQTNRTARPAYVVLLIPGGPVRGEGEIKRVELPPGKGIVTFQLSLLSETKYLRYRATLRSDDDRVINSWIVPDSINGPGGRVVPVSIRAARLRPHIYKLVLEGVTGGGSFREIATYHFEVEKSKAGPH